MREVYVQLTISMSQRAMQQAAPELMPLRQRLQAVQLPVVTSPRLMMPLPNMRTAVWFSHGACHVM